MNGKKAEISSGEARETSVTDADGNVTKGFLDLLLTLGVTPQLNPNDKITLEIDINQTTPQDTGQDVDKNTLTTTVVVNDGDTIVLGGVFKVDSVTRNQKIPLLGDIPLIGAAFKHQYKEESKRELLIFITPKLIREALTAR